MELNEKIQTLNLHIFADYYSENSCHMRVPVSKYHECMNISTSFYHNDGDGYTNSVHTVCYHQKCVNAENQVSITKKCSLLNYTIKRALHLSFMV